MRSRFWLTFIFLVTIALGIYIFRKETTPRQEIYYRRGLDFARTGQYDLALMELDRALSYNPDFAPAYNNIGVVYSRLGRRGDAIEALGKAVQVDPSFPEAWYNLGKIYMELSMEERALEYLKEAFRLDPDYDKARKAVAEVYYGIAREIYSDGEYNQAEYNVSRAYDHDPERADITDLWAKVQVKLGYYDEAIELFQKAARQDPDLEVAEDISDTLEQKGESLYKKGEFDDAERYLSSALKKNPGNGRANYFLGLCYSRSGDIDKAIKLLQKGLKLDDRILPDTDRASYHAFVASGLKNSKNYEKAVKEYQLSSAVDPGFEVGRDLAECYFWLGRDQFERGQNNKALPYFDKAVELEPGSKDYRIALARALDVSEKPGRAVSEYRYLLKMDPGSADIRVHLARALMKAGLYSEAVSDLERAKRIRPDLSLDKDLAEAYYGRGWAAERLGEFQKAINDYTYAVKMDPEHKDAWLRIGACYEKMDDVREAMKVYRKYLDDPDIGWRCHFRLGVCLMKSGEREAAIGYAQKRLDRGDRLRDVDKFDEAFEEYSMASQIAPDWEYPYWVKAQSHYFRMEYNKCVPYLEKSLELAPDNPMFLNDLATVYARLGRYKEAEALFHKAIKMKSPYYRACINLSNLYGMMNQDKEALWWARRASEVKKGFSQKGESGFWLR